MTHSNRTHDRRRVLVAGAAGLAATLAPRWGRAQSFPSRPLRLVVPFPPGGPTDIVARPLAQMMGEAFGQTVLVDNRGGAGGSIAAEFVARSAQDGYTLLMGTVGTNAINGSLYRSLPHHPVNDFTPIALVASAPVALVVHPSVPIRSIQDLIQQVKARPGSLSFGSAGSGTPGHLTGVRFAAAAGIELQHVPYRGSAPAIADLLGNQIPMMFDPLQSVISQIRGGNLRILGLSSATRSPVLPDVPTMAESGLPGFESTAWWAVFGPAGLPPTVTQRLREEVARIATSAAYGNRLGDLGVVPSSAPLSLPEFQKAEVEKWGAAVRASGAVVD